MKKLILATAVTAAVVVYFVGDKDQPVEDNTVMQNPAEQTDSMVESTNVSGAQVAVSDKSAVSESAMPSSSSDGQDYSAYNQDNNSLELSHITMTTILRQAVIVLVKIIEALITVLLMALRVQTVLIETATMTTLIQRILRKKNYRLRNSKESMIMALFGMAIRVH
jgi:hypothetical protein